jgi:hypothetical protein
VSGQVEPSCFITLKLWSILPAELHHDVVAIQQNTEIYVVIRKYEFDFLVSYLMSLQLTILQHKSAHRYLREQY